MFSCCVWLSVCCYAVSKVFWVLLRWCYVAKSKIITLSKLLWQTSYLASRKVTQTHTCTTIPASLSQHIGFIVCIVPCRSGKRPQRCGIWVSVQAELLLAMISQIAPLPSPPSVSISHGWPHSSAPLASSGASLCNAGSFWFSGLYKKSAKGKGRCTERGCKHWHGRFFFQAWFTRHIIRFFLSRASSIQGEAVLSGGVGTIVRGKCYWMTGRD